MKRFLLAALLALTIHGIFFGFVPLAFEKKPPAKPHIITISLASYHPVKPKPAAKPARITQEVHSRKLPKKKQDNLIRPLPEKKATKPKTKPTPPVKTVTASLAAEKKIVPVKPPSSTHASASPKGDVALPIDPFPDIPEDSGVERGTEIASIPPAKVVREARPAYKDNPRPVYPKRARRRGYEGTVILEVLVDRTGRVKELRVLTSSGHSVLDRAALKSVNGWLFEPGMVGDQKVGMWVKVPVRFELRGG